MAEHPSGTVTFLFTDIEGSTKLAQVYPDKWEELRARHHAILQSAIEAHNGYVFQIIGDAFCAAFHTAKEGINSAIEAQRNLQSEDWGGTPVKVRMGLHTGEAELQSTGDYHGYLAMSRVQRLMSAGHGGQVLISQATQELIRDDLSKDISLRDLGEKRLKDLIRPEHIYQLVILNLPVDFPPLKTLDIYRHNLPPQLTSFIGREKEMNEIRQTLAKHRLVTLTGSGGSGKTRLSLQVAADLLDQFPNGIWFVELAPITDPDLIPQTILSAADMQTQQGRSALDSLKDFLREKTSLLILDNCEHLIEACAKLADTLLHTAPNLKILASSREALGVRGEQAWHVPSLSIPDLKHLPPIEQLSQYEAVRLFIDRALLVQPHFAVTNDNAPAVAQICSRLDGIPLAIELAAARVKVLKVEQIAERLNDRFRLLTGGSRTALPRQQTLRALIDWSFDLLFENEKLLLRRLSVFMGGWTLEAAEQVCSDDSIHAEDVLDLLTHLVDKSLVVIDEEPSQLRYRMLETIRQYAREKLFDTEEASSIRDKHLGYFVKLTEQAEPELYRSNQVFWLNKLEVEIDNFRMALEWALATDVKSGLQIATDSADFWGGRGYVQELCEWLLQLLERYHSDDALHALAQTVYSSCLLQQGNINDAIKIAEQSLQMARIMSDKRVEAFSLGNLGAITFFHGRAKDGELLLEQSLALYRDLDDKVGQSVALGLLSIQSNNLEQALSFGKESLKLSRELGNLSGISNCLISLSRTAMRDGNYSSATAWLEEVLSISRQLGFDEDEETALIIFGNMAYWQGDYQRAIAYYEQALALGEKIGAYIENLWTCVHIAYAVLRQGNLQKARQLFQESIQKTTRADLLIGLVFAIEGIASLYVNQNQPERAVQLFAWTDAMREKLGDHRPPVEQNSVAKDLAVIHSKLSNEEFAKLSTEGRAMTMDQAVEYALNELG